jgi:hypothetical protein
MEEHLMAFLSSSLADLARLRTGVRRRRISSYDTTGGNADYWPIEPGERKTLAEMDGPGVITHIWMTMNSDDKHLLRRSVLRMFWDDEPTPCVEAPIGDFFGMGHAMCKDFWSLPLTMSPDRGRGFNSFWAMPFYKHARIEVENEAEANQYLYFYVDYETHDALEAGLAHFHAQWRRENPTDGFDLSDTKPNRDRDKWRELWKMANLDAKGNYVILEAEGKGHYVGCHLDIDCFEPGNNLWYGEGDDMIFIDGEPLPSIYGTGTEDYFNTAYCPSTEFSAPFQGIALNSGGPHWRWGGKNSVFRYHITDPIMFEKSIKVTIEHGHANNGSYDYASTAYWYQTLPHAPFPKLLPVEQRLPRD